MMWERVKCPRGGYLQVSRIVMPILLGVELVSFWSLPRIEAVGKNISNPSNKTKPYRYLYLGPIVFLFVMNRWVRGKGWLYKSGTGNKLV